MFIVCLDLEGVLTPEVWINVAKKTGIDELKLTTRDISDYDVLMKKRLRILKDNNITLTDIQNVISEMDLLPGAKKFLDQLRSETQVIILSDTFIEFAHKTFMKKLDYPVLLCHSLDVEKESGMIRDYKIRLKDHKRKTVTALKKMNYSVVAVGDSYNDTEMLKEADFGIFFRPPENVIKEFPQFPVVTEYSDFKKLIFDYIKTPK
jgi:phosphoserine/homoserine phosphotransferase